ncbi:MAG TPA: VacJ family lipoprotein [Sphingomonadaceae bacterium]|nr:VacJ family lipoprotein [Sphingomonadaceae bacterium]
MRRATSILCLMALSACATTGNVDRLTQEKDPLEGFNRGMWNVNQALDKVAMKPASSVYRTVTPKPARRGLSRILANLEEPWSFINNLLQGKPKRAVRNLGRFVVNTTIGVGGLADHATELGIEDSPEDFGQTLATWGVKSGPYLVLPLLGPSTVRDGIGSGVAMFADPWRVCLDQCVDTSTTTRLGVSAAQIVILRADATESGADTFLKTSLDPYAAARSAYFQSRRAAIRDNENESGAQGEPAAADASGDAALDAAVADLKAQAGEDQAPAGEAAPSAAGNGETAGPSTPAPTSKDKE